MELTYVPYREEYFEAMAEMNRIMALSVRYHPDVFQKSVIVALLDGVPVGFGFLAAGPTFLDRKHCKTCHIHVEFTAEKGHPLEVEVSAGLLEELQAIFREMEQDYPEKKLVLRTWTRATAKSYLEFLMQFGFMIRRSTPLMVRDLSDLSDLSEDFSLPRGLTIKVLQMDDAVMERYIEATAKAFLVPDSAGELRFRLAGGTAKVYAVLKGEEIIASVTIWEISESRYATENIFCIPAYQRQGIASTLLRAVLFELAGAGVREASLTVFGDNNPAQLMYLGLGYEVEDILLEMHYETNPTFLLY